MSVLIKAVRSEFEAWPKYADRIVLPSKGITPSPRKYWKAYKPYPS